MRQHATFVLGRFINFAQQAGRAAAGSVAGAACDAAFTATLMMNGWLKLLHLIREEGEGGEGRMHR
jgi:hypothetical protein